jgi:hypothetical protein
VAAVGAAAGDEPVGAVPESDFSHPTTTNDMPRTTLARVRVFM